MNKFQDSQVLIAGGVGFIASSLERRLVSLGARATDLALLMTQVLPGAAFEVIPFPPKRKAIDIGDYYSNFSLIHEQLGFAGDLGRRGRDRFRNRLFDDAEAAGERRLNVGVLAMELEQSPRPGAQDRAVTKAPS